MPPSYKPLEGPGIPVMPQGFGQPEQPVDFVSLVQARQQAEALQQAREIALAQQQRDEATRQQIAEQAKAQGDAFSPEAGLRLAQRLYLEGGNLDKAIAAERVLNDRMTDQPLSPELLTAYRNLGLDLPEGSTERTAQNMNRVRGTLAYEGIVNDPTRAQNRELQGLLMQQKATGTQIKSPTEEITKMVGNSNAFRKYIADVEATYMPYISQNRGVRFLTRVANTNSAEFRLMGELNLAAKQAALSLEPRVTDQDYQVIQEISTPNDRDTNETIVDRMHRLAQFVETRIQENLKAYGAANYNVEGLQALQGGGGPQQPDPLNVAQSLAGQPDPSGVSPEERAWIEQYKQSRRGQ